MSGISGFLVHVRRLTKRCFPQLLGVTSSQDRALIKKKIKDLKVSMEKAKRNQEKTEKQREKLRRRDLEREQKGGDNAAE